MSPSPVEVAQYFVFLASPSDVQIERQAVRTFFERYNRQTAQLWKVRFEVIDWENYSTIGVGRPQELITQQTLTRFNASLALVIGIMGQRFGTPTGDADSGTEEEFRWALESNQKLGFPEIKWFFRRIDQFIAPPDIEAAAYALEQWRKVKQFRDELTRRKIFFAEYPDANTFSEILANDLNLWLAAHARPWVTTAQSLESTELSVVSPPHLYYENVEREFRRLDIAGIDNDRTFEIPLSEIYVRLRVIFDEDLQPEPETIRESGAIDIQTALLRYRTLVIVGDPGSGKSTFLKYVALMIAKAVLANDTGIALDTLCLQEPLPVPFYISCWDLFDFLTDRNTVSIPLFLEFVSERSATLGCGLTSDAIEKALHVGNCCLLIDGLDEVPTDNGRATVSRLLEECLQQFNKNRFVITSRIRAYTGDTILKGGVTRCDIQPFDSNDRLLFLRNWMALLFKIPTEDVMAGGSEARRELDALLEGIETSDRIRPLAVNPLLLTVIAIVHWNRKRLPEQRVDLYDECVDVLLGQRKEAERVQMSRKIGAADELHEGERHEERAWVRKRFAEIALHILLSDGNRDEASKSDIIKLLIPRFLDRGASNVEQAASRADLFLERQELRSGLLVS